MTTSNVSGALFRICFLISAAGFAMTATAQRQMEHLGRGLIAIKDKPSHVFVSWRLLGTDPDEIAFNVYRSVKARTPLRLNKQPLTDRTNFSDDNPSEGEATSYFVRPILKGVEQEPSKAFLMPAGAPVRPYLSIPLQTPAGYTPNDGSVGDLDGDGEYEIVLHQA